MSTQEGNTLEIGREEWPSFLDEFSRQHQGEMATLEAMSEDVGDQTETPLPFGGISFDAKGSAAGTITLMLGTERGDHIERAVAAPTHVRLKLAGEATPLVLEIEAEGEPTLLLHLEPCLALPSPGASS